MCCHWVLEYATDGSWAAAMLAKVETVAHGDAEHGIIHRGTGALSPFLYLGYNLGLACAEARNNLDFEASSFQ